MVFFFCPPQRVWESECPVGNSFLHRGTEKKTQTQKWSGKKRKLNENDADTKRNKMKTRRKKKIFWQTLNSRLLLEYGPNRPQTLSKCISDASPQFIVRHQRTIVFRFLLQKSASKCEPFILEERWIFEHQWQIRLQKSLSVTCAFSLYDPWWRENESVCVFEVQADLAPKMTFIQNCLFLSIYFCMWVYRLYWRFLCTSSMRPSPCPFPFV